MVHPFEDHCWQDVVPADILELYTPYRRETFVGKRPALLAIDLYELAYQGGPNPVLEVAKTYPSSCGEYAWAAIEPTKKLFAAARRAGLPVFYSTSETRTDALAVQATLRRGISLNPQDYRIHEAFAPQPGDITIYKQRASAFYGTPLVAQLTMAGVDSVIVFGESTSGCVRASAVDAYSNGFHVVLAEEACYDRSPLSHKISLFDLHHKYADVIRIDGIVADLNARPAR
jgi:nicotinamidase-related amidase